jgi:transcriptional regulator with PAS, ATPase and Fis domain
VLKQQSNSAEMRAIDDDLHFGTDQITRAAGLPGISRTTLWRKMAKYGLKWDIVAPLRAQNRHQPKAVNQV